MTHHGAFCAVAILGPHLAGCILLSVPQELKGLGLVHDLVDDKEALEQKVREVHLTTPYRTIVVVTVNHFVPRNLKRE